MHRNISFALTTEQFRNQTKTVTRRLKWLNLKVGDYLMGCVKCQGIKPGEQIERLGMIIVTDVRRERLDCMLRTTCAKAASRQRQQLMRRSRRRAMRRQSRRNSLDTKEPKE